MNEVSSTGSGASGQIGATTISSIEALGVEDNGLAVKFWRIPNRAILVGSYVKLEVCDKSGEGSTPLRMGLIQSLATSMI